MRQSRPARRESRWRHRRRPMARTRGRVRAVAVMDLDGTPYVRRTTLSLVLDARTGAVTTFSLATAGQPQPSLGGLGHVSTL
jgi:hypothetical protein